MHICVDYRRPISYAQARVETSPSFILPCVGMASGEPVRNRLKSLQTCLGKFLTDLHASGAPDILVKLVYYLNTAAPLSDDDLVDSLEVFAGCKSYSKAPLPHLRSTHDMPPDNDL